MGLPSRSPCLLCAYPMPHSPPNPPNMPHTPLKAARMRTWAGLSPLATKHHWLDWLNAEGHHVHHDDDLAVVPVLSLATRFRRAASSAAEEENDAGKDMGPTAVPVPAWAPMSTSAPALALARAPTPMPAPPLLPMDFVPAPACLCLHWHQHWCPPSRRWPSCQHPPPAPTLLQGCRPPLRHLRLNHRQSAWPMQSECRVTSQLATRTVGTSANSGLPQRCRSSTAAVPQQCL